MHLCVLVILCVLLLETNFLVDMWSLGSVSHEDLMKLCWTNLKPLFWNHATLMKLRRFYGTYVEQALNTCPPHESIIRKECLMFVIHIVDLVALVKCIWSLLCFLICWNIFQQVKMCLLICWMDCSGKGSWNGGWRWRRNGWWESWWIGRWG